MIDVIYGDATLPNPSGQVHRRPTSYRFYHGGAWSPISVQLSLSTATPVGRAGSNRRGVIRRATEVLTVGGGDENVTRETSEPIRIRAFA